MSGLDVQSGPGGFCLLEDFLANAQSAADALEAGDEEVLTEEIQVLNSTGYPSKLLYDADGKRGMTITLPEITLRF